MLRKLLNTDKFDAEMDLKKLEIPDAKIVTEKIGFIAEGVREIFSLPPYEKGGLTELECVQLLMEFSEFLERIKKNGTSKLILLPPTGNPAATVNDLPGQSSTKESSDSISTPAE